MHLKFTLPFDITYIKPSFQDFTKIDLSLLAKASPHQKQDSPFSLDNLPVFSVSNTLFCQTFQ